MADLCSSDRALRKEPEAAVRDRELKCPECGSAEVAVTAEQMFMVNSGEHYCHSVKTQDDDAKATCLHCRWIGVRQDLAIGSELRKAASGCSHTARSDGAKE